MKGLFAVRFRKGKIAPNILKRKKKQRTYEIPLKRLILQLARIIGGFNLFYGTAAGKADPHSNIGKPRQSQGNSWGR